MQLLILPLLFAASTLAFPNPQSLSQLPVCAQQAALSAIDASGCGYTDVACLCTSVPFLNTLRTYIEQHCSTADQTAALAFSQTTCGSYGVTFSASVTMPSTTTTIVAPAPATPLAGTATSTLTDAVPPPTTPAPTYPTMTPSTANASLVGNFTGAATGGFEYEAALAIAGLAGVVAFVV